MTGEKRGTGEQRFKHLFHVTTSLNGRKITVKCSNSGSFSCLTPETAARATIRGTIVYVSKVPLQKVNIYHALFIPPLEQSATVTTALQRASPRFLKLRGSLTFPYEFHSSK